jgi:hypothetical protein
MQQMQPLTADQYNTRQEALKNAKIFKFEMPEPDIGYLLQILQFSPSPWAIINPIITNLNEQIRQQVVADQKALQLKNQADQEKMQKDLEEKS